MSARPLPAGPLRDFIADKDRYYSREDMAGITGVSVKKIYRLMNGQDDVVAFHTADAFITRLHGVACAVYGDVWYETVPVQA